MSAVGTSTVISLSLASMVEVGSGLCCSLVEAELGRYVARESGGEITIIFGSVDTAALESRSSLSGLKGPKDRKSASNFEKIAKMLSLKEQSSVVAAIEYGGSGITTSNRNLSHLAKNKKSSSCNQKVNSNFRGTYSIPGAK